MSADDPVAKRQKTGDPNSVKVDVPAHGDCEWEHKVVDGKPLPLLVQCNSPECSVEDAAAWTAAEQARLKSLLGEHGALLFRGFPLKTDQDFDAFVSAFDGWVDLPYDESLAFAVRVQRTPRVCTTNEGKSGGLVFHHEQAAAPLYPSRVFFYCERPAEPGDGGQTGVSPSWVLWKELQERHPEFARKCEEKGVKYSFTIPGEQDPSKGAGRSWKSYFSVSTEEELEKRLKELGYTWDWVTGETGAKLLHATTPVLSAVREADGKKVFFNQMVATIANAVEFSSAGKTGGEYKGDGPTQEGLDAFLRFADGSSVDISVLQWAREVCEKHAVNVEWKQGDVVLLDNFQVMHARRIWNGPAGTRRVLASLVK